MKNAIATSKLLSLLWALCVSGAATTPGQVHVLVASVPDPTGVFPDSRLYTATLANDTRAELVLHAVQMPGGYAGSGTFFSCWLDEWDVKKRVWRTVFRDKRAVLVDDAPFPLSDVRVAPGGQREVCRLLLPQQGGHHGARMRMRVWRSWDPTADSWLSAPFMLHEKPGAGAKR